MQIARSLVVYLKRAGGQSQYSAPLAAQVAMDAEFADLHGWIREHLHEDLNLNVLAKRAGMSPRTLERRYIAKLGQTPLKVLETMRLEAARASLEDASLSLKQIARLTGFGDEQRLRRVFYRKFGVAPIDYRERFLDAGAYRSPNAKRSVTAQRASTGQELTHSRFRRDVSQSGRSGRPDPGAPDNTPR